MHLSVRCFLIVLADTYSVCSSGGGLGRACVVSRRGVQDYLEIMSHLNSYAGYIEIVTAQQLYNIYTNVIIAGTPVLPPIPSPPLNNSLFFIYHPHAMHYSTLALHLNPPHIVVVVAYCPKCGIAQSQLNRIIYRRNDTIFATPKESLVVYILLVINSIAVVDTRSLSPR